MKFITLATSALAAGFALAAPTRGGNHHSGHHSVGHRSAYSRAETQQQKQEHKEIVPQDKEPFFLSPFDISSVVQPQQVYKAIQELAKIPEDKFVGSFKDLIAKSQFALNVSFDFLLRVELLNDEEKQDVKAWLDEASEKYEHLSYDELVKKQKEIIGDLLDLVEIVYGDEAIKFLSELEKEFPNTI